MFARFLNKTIAAWQTSALFTPSGINEVLTYVLATELGVCVVVALLSIIYFTFDISITTYSVDTNAMLYLNFFLGCGFYIRFLNKKVVHFISSSPQLSHSVKETAINFCWFIWHACSAVVGFLLFWLLFYIVVSSGKINAASFWSLVLEITAKLMDAWMSFKTGAVTLSELTDTIGLLETIRLFLAANIRGWSRVQPALMPLVLMYLLCLMNQVIIVFWQVHNVAHAYFLERPIPRWKPAQLLTVRYIAFNIIIAILFYVWINLPPCTPANASEFLSIVLKILTGKTVGIHDFTTRGIITFLVLCPVAPAPICV